jgi:hypothetical protein
MSDCLSFPSSSLKKLHVHMDTSHLCLRTPSGLKELLFNLNAGCTAISSPRHLNVKMGPKLCLGTDGNLCPTDAMTCPLRAWVTNVGKRQHWRSG